jgi:hypothetical protein
VDVAGIISGEDATGTCDGEEYDVGDRLWRLSNVLLTGVNDDDDEDGTDFDRACRPI